MATARMKRVGSYQHARDRAASCALLEVLCLAGVIDKITMPPPHRIARDLVKLLASGALVPAIVKTPGQRRARVRAGATCVGDRHRHACCTATARVRETLDPLFATYYAIPIFAFYPLFIVIFGLGDVPQMLIGFMLGVVAVIVNTLNGLDRVPRVLLKTARIHRLGPLETALHVTLPFCGAVPAHRRQARGRVRVHRRDRRRVHHVARRHGLRDRLRLHQFRQRDDVSADPADPARCRSSSTAFCRVGRRCCSRGGGSSDRRRTRPGATPSS